MSFVEVAVDLLEISIKPEAMAVQIRGLTSIHIH